MRGEVILLAVFVAVGLACNDFGNLAPETSPVEPPLGPTVGSGHASFSLNGSKHDISVFSQRNGYVPNEVVLRGSGERLENTLMLTFKPVQGKSAEINLQMTGYWDLGFVHSLQEISPFQCIN